MFCEVELFLSYQNGRYGTSVLVTIRYHIYVYDINVML